jgi:type IX secretion system PorP/SprF family membrane protein
MRLLVCILFFFSAFGARAQYTQQFSQYMFNGLIINPAYAGVRECLSIVGVHSSQWVGFEGAPMSDNITAHTPFGKHSGAGLTLFNDRIAQQNQTGIYGSYAYHLRTGENSKLSFGVSGGVSIFSIQDADVVTVENDAVFQKNGQVFSFPNMGAGLFFYRENFYTGLSIPTLFSSEYSAIRENELFSVRTNNMVIMQTSGAIIPLGDHIRWKPSYLVKLIPSLSSAIDLNSNFYFKEAFTIGASYRVKNALVALIGCTIKKKFDLGYSFSYPLSDLANYSSGTHEIMLRYELREIISSVNPRLY